MRGSLTHALCCVHAYPLSKNDRRASVRPRSHSVARAVCIHVLCQRGKVQHRMQTHGLTDCARGVAWHACRMMSAPSSK